MAEYLGVRVVIPPNDPDHLEFLRAASDGRLALQRCSDCALLRYPPGPACPFCQSLDSEWSDVSGKGTIYSYEVVMHPIHPAYRERAPYPVALVELDVDPTNVVYRREAGATPPMPPCGRRAL